LVYEKQKSRKTDKQRSWKGRKVGKNRKAKSKEAGKQRSKEAEKQENAVKDGKTETRRSKEPEISRKAQ
jgi:hypothetical protein